MKTLLSTALSIAGSDCSGGAGIQADIKTMTMNGVYAMSAITALTAQNTTGVEDIFEISSDFLKRQIDMIFTDIYPDAVKIGMVSNSELIEAIAERLNFYEAKNIVVDPVMVATSGSKLIESDAVITLKKSLIPMATIVTPNIPEAEILSGIKISCKEDMIMSAKSIGENYGCSVLLKGGHNLNDANDLLYSNGELKWFYGRKIDNPNTHGTGCTLSSAIASNLAKGYDIENSIRKAKDYISGALESMLNLGKGRGPINHAFNLNTEFSKEEKIMKTVEYLLEMSKEIWDKYNKHPFVMGIEDGTLNKEKFRYYIIQDYLYLQEYAKTFAIGIAKSKSSEMVKLFSKYINIITGELNIHRGYMGELKISEEELKNTPRSLDNLSYTSYMIRVAYEEGEAEIISAILSCAYSYEVIAKNIIKNNPLAKEHHFYGEWVKGYSSESYSNANVILFETLENLTKDYTKKQIAHLSDIFMACSRYELAFWEMSWNMDK